MTGAGDTVLSMLSFALANGVSLEDAVRLSNVAAGVAVERLGCTQISLAELAQVLVEKRELSGLSRESL